MKRRIHLVILSVLAVFLMAPTPPDTGIVAQYGYVSTPLTMPYNGLNGNAIIASQTVSNSTLGNQFTSPFRGTVTANNGGAYNGTTQTGFFGSNNQGSMITQGQLGGYWGFESGVGKGNAFFGNGVASCWGGGETDLPSSTPECVAAGEFDTFQGGTQGLVWSGVVTGAPAMGATTIHYTTPINNAALGARAILNLDHVTGGTGTISSYTQCDPGSGSPCPTNCPEGVGSSCTVIQFAGSNIDTTAGRQWYYKTAPNQNDYYNPPCVGDDVDFPNGGGISVAKCIGHWYRVASVDSATQITLYGSFDQQNIGTYVGTASYVMVEGIEASQVDPVGETLTLPTNNMLWANAGIHLFASQSIHGHGWDQSHLYQVV